MTEPNDTTEPARVVGPPISVPVEIDPIAAGVGSHVEWESEGRKGREQEEDIE